MYCALTSKFFIQKLIHHLVFHTSLVKTSHVVILNPREGGEVKPHQLPGKENPYKYFINAPMTSVPKKVMIFPPISQIHLFIHVVVNILYWVHPFASSLSLERNRETGQEMQKVRRL